MFNRKALERLEKLEKLVEKLVLTIPTQCLLVNLEALTITRLQELSSMDHAFMISLWKPLEVLFLRKPLNRCFQISLSKVVDPLYSWNIRVKNLPRKSQFVKILDVFITKTEVIVNSLWGERFCSPLFRLLPCTNKQLPGCEVRT